MLGRERVDAVLLDINMDDLNGWQTAQLIRSGPSAPQVPIIFVSADPFENRQDLLDAVDAQGFVSKPVVESELLERLEHALELEWVHESHPEPLVRAAAADGPALAHATGAAALELPDELRQRLITLARQGNASGLRMLLREWEAEAPALTDVIRSLLAHVDRFDFAALVEQLKVRFDDDDESPS